MSEPIESSADSYRYILGVRFYVGPVEGLIEQTMRGGLIVVPSAPVLVGLQDDAVHRRALETSDLAVTDSGFMVLLWRLIAREKINRISGLRYLRVLLQDVRFCGSRSILWIMPSKLDDIANRAWLIQQGISVDESDCYLAPMYPREGGLEDPALLELIRKNRPRFVMINLGGGVQERLGMYLRDALAESLETAPCFSAEPTESVNFPRSAFRLPPSREVYRPALICTGAAIAFLSSRQVNIPPWADRLFLGWLMRIIGSPNNFIPRYFRALRLAVLILKHRSHSVVESRRRV
jgi:UDP-N-acetyl-D-mannosaminuronic acid transferase (WecB/TagA/CpsF family)